MTPTRQNPLSIGRVTPLTRLRALGQAVWLDYLRRDFLLQGGLRALIERDGITGVNCDTTTLAQAIAWTGQYDAAVAEWIRRGETDARVLYERLAVADVQTAADQLRDVYERTDRRDGYVSLAVSPDTTDDPEAILGEAQRLWRGVDRPNLMLGVYATDAGLTALAELIAAGHNVNVLLVGGLGAHARVIEAYLTGLERRAGELGGIASVASLCVGRIDQTVGRAAGDPALAVDGELGLAIARCAYQQWKKLHSGRRWTALAARGARPQRLGFVATGVERRGVPDGLYVDALVGRETISAMSIATLDAYRERGIGQPTLEQHVDHARSRLAAAAAGGLDDDGLAASVVSDGVARYRADFDTLLAALARKRAEVQSGLPPLNPPRGDSA